MTRAVIFDMFETLITHYNSPLYFGAQMAKDAGIPEDQFQVLWHSTEQERTVGKLTFEDVIKRILREQHCYSEQLFKEIVEKRIAAKEECFRHLHTEIIPMLSTLKERGFLVGLISNCFSEEAEVIRRSELFPRFDAIYLSYEQGIQKPDEEIFQRCMEELSVKAEECIYVGDGGSYELETARKLGMKAVQAAWYLQEGTTQPSKRKHDFIQIEKPLDIVNICEGVIMQEVFQTNQKLSEMLGTEKYNVWTGVCNLVENLYEMDILRKNTNWNNWRYEHKYRRGGKTLCTLYAKENCFSIQIVFGKEERARFENEQHTYSDEIQNIYHNSTTYHDGKWMSFEPGNSLLEDIQKLLLIKRKPNKKKTK